MWKRKCTQFPSGLGEALSFLDCTCLFPNAETFFQVRNNFSYCTSSLQHNQMSAENGTFVTAFLHGKKEKYSQSLLRKCHKTETKKFLLEYF